MYYNDLDSKYSPCIVVQTLISKCNGDKAEAMAININLIVPMRKTTRIILRKYLHNCLKLGRHLLLYRLRMQP